VKRPYFAAGCAALMFACAIPRGGLAAKATFKIIATLPGSPVIGAWHKGVLYGTTPSGGSGNAGTLFSLTEAGDATILHDFETSPDGAAPNGQLALASGGVIYGTASGGGVYGGGTLWEYGAGGFATLHAFGASGDGADPKQGPAVHGGVVYGSAAAGAIATNGMVFSLSGGTYATLHDFVSGTDGHCPFSGVAFAKGKILFGTTVGNGFGGQKNGSVWKLAAGGSLTTLYAFTDGADGEYPDQAPTADAAGNVYGTTHVQGGNSFPGTVWKIGAGGFSLLHSFVAATDGSIPNSPLLLDYDGNLYGTTATGGPGGYGTLYRITPAGVFTVLHAFTHGTDGANPTGSLARDTAGNLYGATATGQVFRAAP
jgi:uncharacterized repeat protein (TIGR03803 family)